MIVIPVNINGTNTAMINFKYYLKWVIGIFTRAVGLD